MTDFRIKLNRPELIILYILITFFFVEFLALMSLVHFAKFPMFIPLFIKTVKILTPIFLAINVAFVASIMLVRGRNLIIRSWTDYLRELVRFSTLSLMITVAIMTVSALLGALFGLLIEEMGETPIISGLLASLRAWVTQNFY